MKNSIVGNYVRERREVAGLSIRAAAIKTGISPGTLYKFEHGEFALSAPLLRKLCKVLGCSYATAVERMMEDSIVYLERKYGSREKWSGK